MFRRCPGNFLEIPEIVPGYVPELFRKCLGNFPEMLWKIIRNIQEVFQQQFGIVPNIYRTCLGQFPEMFRKLPGNSRTCSGNFPEISQLFPGQLDPDFYFFVGFLCFSPAFLRKIQTLGEILTFLTALPHCAATRSPPQKKKKWLFCDIISNSRKQLSYL